jgi:UDP-N-acetylglucosamine--N-acetylmuramyl-(pentapeptide) pyrophosphoryl-undecaprenol N-acetylglucosamine transferase
VNKRSDSDTLILVGGGSGGHITPLVAVASILKIKAPDIKIVGVCEKGCLFKNIFTESHDFESVHQIRSGKFRRYPNRTMVQRVTDIKTIFFNSRDIGYVFVGIVQSIVLLKKLKAKGIFIKGGFVGVPIGIAARILGVPIITHDSDSTPGLANKIIARWALQHATGMPKELYSYPQEKVIYTGIPLNNKFIHVNEQEQQKYKRKLAIKPSAPTITIIGGSQGGDQLNTDVAYTMPDIILKHNDVSILHIVGEKHTKKMNKMYDELLDNGMRSRVNVCGFVSNPYDYMGAADIVISRAGANTIAELAVQAKPSLLVPGKLAGDHQRKNAQYLLRKNAILLAEWGDRKSLHDSMEVLLEDKHLRRSLSDNIAKIAKPNAANTIAVLLITTLLGRESN